MTGPDDDSPEPGADASGTGPTRPLTPFQERLGRVAVQWMAGVNAVAFRMSGGRVAAHVPGGAPICLVTTIGRRTGRRRTVPLLYLPCGDDEIVLVASHGGMSTHPGWYLNLVADPHAVVDTDRGRVDMEARPATEAERADLWPRLVAIYPRFETYRRRTARVIPLVILRPTPPAGAPRDRNPPASPR